MQSFLNVGRFFLPYRKWVLGVVALQLVAGFAENLGIVTLLPMIQALMSGEREQSWVTGLLRELIGSLHLPDSLNGYLVLALVAMTLKAVLGYGSLRAGHALVLNVMLDVRLALLRGVIGLRWPMFSQLKSGDVVSLQITEMERFRPNLSLFLTLMTSTVQVGLYVAASLIVSWQLTILAVVFGVLKTATLRPFRHGAFRLGSAYSTYISNMSVGLLEGLTSIKPIRAMGMDRNLLQKLGELTRNYGKTMDALMRNSALFTIADDYVTSVILVLVLLVCASFLTVDLAQFAVIGVLMNRILVQIGSLQKALNAISSTASIVTRIRESLDGYARDAECNAGSRKIELHDALRFDGVSLGYGGAPVLRDVNLSIPAGTLCAVVGQSGGGKTTLIDTVLGLVAPLAGTVTIDGHQLADADIASWRRRIGYVPQDIALFNDSILNNITIGREDITEAQVRRALQAAEALDFVEALPQGLQASVGERGTALSGGQRQRLALARALVHEPDLLILDEATAALDPKTEEEICQTLRRLAGKRTILAISHQSRITEIADMIIEVGNGRAAVMKRTVKAHEAQNL